MGADKFLNDVDDIKITDKDYKSKVDKRLKTKFEDEPKLNLLTIEKEVKVTEKKVAMSIYFKENDLKILKAVAQNKEITVNKLISEIIEGPLKVTKDNLPNDFNVDALAKEYDKNNKKKSNKKPKI